MTSKLLFFPIGAPDELLYSLLARYAKMAGGLTPRAAMADVLGSENLAAVWDLPCHLGALAQALRVPVSNLRDQCTLFPYYGSTLLPKQRATLHRWMEGDRRGSSVHAVSGVTASSVRATKKLRYCAQCAREDILEWEAPAWRRLHQCPGVVLCPGHAIPLTESTVSVNARSHKHFAVSLESALKLGGRPLRVVDPARSLAIANWTQRLLNGQGPSGAAAWRNHHLQQLAQGDWLTANGRVRWKSLLPALLPILPAALWQHLGLRTDIEHPCHWLPSLLRAPRKSAHPLLHILTALLLEELTKHNERVAKPDRRLRHRTKRTKATTKVGSDTVLADRHAWSLLAEKYPEGGAKVWRSYVHGLYARLYRHSRDWLLSWNANHRVLGNGRCLRVNWVEQDRRLRSQLVAAATRLTAAADSRRHRITQASLLRELGVPGLHPVQLSKMPEFREALKVVAETKDAYLRRRLSDAMWDWTRQSAHLPKPWQLLRLANVRWPWSAHAKLLASEEIDRYLWRRPRNEAKSHGVESAHRGVAAGPTQPSGTGRRRIA